MGQINVKAKTASVFGTLKVVTVKQTYSTISNDIIVARVAQTANIPTNTIQAALLGIKEAVRYFCLNGHRVQLGDFGTFGIGVNAKAVAQASQVSANLIQSTSLNYSPSAKVKEALSNVTFS